MSIPVYATARNFLPVTDIARISTCGVTSPTNDFDWFHGDRNRDSIPDCLTSLSREQRPVAKCWLDDPQGLLTANDMLPPWVYLYGSTSSALAEVARRKSNRAEVCLLYDTWDLQRDPVRPGTGSDKDSCSRVAVVASDEVP